MGPSHLDGRTELCVSAEKWFAVLPQERTPEPGTHLSIGARLLEHSAERKRSEAGISVAGPGRPLQPTQGQTEGKGLQ